MLGLNLHAITRPIITYVHPDEIVTIYFANGQINQNGIITPIYNEPIDVPAQVQNVGEAVLFHSGKVGESNTTRNFYLYANGDIPPAGLIRQLHRGGDFIKRFDDTFWLIYATPEEFSVNTQWVCVRGTLQTIPPDFSASPWFEQNYD